VLSEPRCRGRKPDGDLRICFAGLTGGYSATGVLGLGYRPPRMETRDRKSPLVFRSWELLVCSRRELCQTIAEVDFIEIHAFGLSAENRPIRWVDPGRLHQRESSACALALRPKGLSRLFQGNIAPDKRPSGAAFTVPRRLTLPDQARILRVFMASALFQKSLRT